MLKLLKLNFQIKDGYVIHNFFVSWVDYLSKIFILWVDFNLVQNYVECPIFSLWSQLRLRLLYNLEPDNLYDHYHNMRS